MVNTTNRNYEEGVLLGSDPFGHVDTVVDLDNEGTNTPLLTLDDELRPDDSVARLSENRNSGWHISCAR